MAARIYGPPAESPQISVARTNLASRGSLRPAVDFARIRTASATSAIISLLVVTGVGWLIHILLARGVHCTRRTPVYGEILCLC